MHDESLERRLRSALIEEADRMPFTITAAELERRASLRNRSGGPRRVTLLLAAAIALGTLTAVGLVGGVMKGPLDSTTAPTNPIAPTGVAPAALPGLDAMLEGIDPARVAVAHAHDRLDTGERSDIPIPAPQVDLGVLAGGAAYEVRVACDADSPLALDIRLAGGPGPASGPSLPCDRSTRVVAVDSAEAHNLSFSAGWTASWRVVVIRSESPTVAPNPDPPLPDLSPAAGKGVLILVQDQTTPSGASADPRGRLLQGVGALPGRWAYRVALWCIGGDAMQYIHGGDIEGTFVAATTTEVPCDGEVHASTQGYPEINGTEGFVAATVETRWGVLVTAELPPVAIVGERPGWQPMIGFGPELNFETHGGSVSDAVEGGGSILVILECAGPAQTVDVSVDAEPQIDTDENQTLKADCQPDGAQTGKSFETQSSGFHVEFVAPAGTWTALSILGRDEPTENP